MIFMRVAPWLIFFSCQTRSSAEQRRRPCLYFHRLSWNRLANSKCYRKCFRRLAKDVCPKCRGKVSGDVPAARNSAALEYFLFPARRKASHVICRTRLLRREPRNLCTSCDCRPECAESSVRE